MGRPKGKKEYVLIQAPSDVFNAKLENFVHRGWKPVPVPCTVLIRGDEFSRETLIYQMMERTFFIEKEEE